MTEASNLSPLPSRRQVGEKRWGEMTADEQVPPWGLLVDTLLLRKQLDTHNAAAAAESEDE